MFFIFSGWLANYLPKYNSAWSFSFSFFLFVYRILVVEWRTWGWVFFEGYLKQSVSYKFYLGDLDDYFYVTILEWLVDNKEGRIHMTCLSHPANVLIHLTKSEDTLGKYEWYNSSQIALTA